MASGSRGYLSGLGGRAACFLFWRGTKKILGAGRFTDSSGAARRIPDKLFRIAGEFVPAGSNGERERKKADHHCRFAGRAGGSGENLPASDGRLHGPAPGICRVLSRLPGEDGELGPSRWSNSTGLRLVACQRAPGNGEQSLPWHGTRGGIPNFGREPAARIRVVFWAGFVLDFVCAQCGWGFFKCSRRARVCEQVPAGGRKDSSRNFAGREFCTMVQGLSLPIRFGGRHAAVHHRGE